VESARRPSYRGDDRAPGIGRSGSRIRRCRSSGGGDEISPPRLASPPRGPVRRDRKDRGAVASVRHTVDSNVHHRHRSSVARPHRTIGASLHQKASPTRAITAEEADRATQNQPASRRGALSRIPSPSPLPWRNSVAGEMARPHPHPRMAWCGGDDGHANTRTDEEAERQAVSATVRFIKGTTQLFSTL